MQNRAFNHDALEQAIYENDDEYVVAYINEKKEDLDYALMRAASYNQLKIVKLLLLAGAKVNAISGEYDETPLIGAAYYGHLDMISTLIENKADVNVAKPNGATAVYMAAQAGHVNVVEKLFQHGASLSANVTPGNNRPLYIAAYTGKLDVVKFLIANQVNVNHVGNDNETAIFVASQWGHYEIVEFLLQQPDIDPNIMFKTNKQSLTSFANAKVPSVKIQKNILKFIERHQEDDILLSNEAIATLMGRRRTLALLLAKGEMPGEFVCPLSQALMADPITVSSGVTYDRSSIEKHYASLKNSDHSIVQ